MSWSTPQNAEPLVSPSGREYPAPIASRNTRSDLSSSEYGLSAIVNGGTLIAVGLFHPGPATLPVITGLIFVNSLSTTFQAMAAENLMAHSTSAAEKGRAGGWYQAGNLGGQGIGGGAALWIAQHTTIGWLPGAAMAALFAACCISLPMFPELTAEEVDYVIAKVVERDKAQG